MAETTGTGVSKHPEHPNSFFIIGNDDWPFTKPDGDDHRTFTSDGSFGIEDLDFKDIRIGFGYDMLTDKPENQRTDQLTLSVSAKLMENTFIGIGVRRTADLHGEQLQTWVHRRIHNDPVRLPYAEQHTDIFAFESYEIDQNFDGVDISGRVTTMISPRFIESSIGMFSVFKDGEGSCFWAGPVYVIQKQIKDRLDVVDYVYDEENGLKAELGFSILNAYFTLDIKSGFMYGCLGLKF
jgi:hypothetical protein